MLSHGVPCPLLVALLFFSFFFLCRLDVDYVLPPILLGRVIDPPFRAVERVFVANSFPYARPRLLQQLAPPSFHSP